MLYIFVPPQVIYKCVTCDRVSKVFLSQFHVTASLFEPGKDMRLLIQLDWIYSYRQKILTSLLLPNWINMQSA